LIVHYPPGPLVGCPYTRPYSKANGWIVPVIAEKGKSNAVNILLIRKICEFIYELFREQM